MVNTYWIPVCDNMRIDSAVTLKWSGQFLFCKLGCCRHAGGKYFVDPRFVISCVCCFVGTQMESGIGDVGVHTNTLESLPLANCAIATPLFGVDQLRGLFCEQQQFLNYFFKNLNYEQVL